MRLVIEFSSHESQAPARYRPQAVSFVRLAMLTSVGSAHCARGHSLPFPTVRLVRRSMSHRAPSAGLRGRARAWSAMGAHRPARPSWSVGGHRRIRHALPPLICRDAAMLVMSSSGRLRTGTFAMVVAGSPRSGLDCVLERAKVTGHFTATFAMRSGIWKVALLKSAYLAACLHLGEVPRTQDADHVREIIRSGSFGLGGDSVGVHEPFPFRVFRIYGASTTTARRLWVGVAWIPWTGGHVPIFGVGLGSVAFVTWPIPDQRQRGVDIALQRRALA